jgi:hypothetical protein
MNTFLIGTLAEPSAQEYADLVSSAPMYVSPSPVIYLTGPSEDVPEPPEGLVDLKVLTHRIVFNPSTDRSEMLVYLTPFPSTSFVPYFRMAVNPMLSKLTRFWTNSVGNSLNGRTLTIQVHKSDNPKLLAEFNPAYDDLT